MVALARSCSGTDFVSRRDSAILHVFLDTGVRRSELADLTVGDVDFDRNVIVVMGKGRRPRTVAFGRATALTLDRYGRARSRHADAAEPWPWLGKRGRLTGNGIHQMLGRRGERVGVPDPHPHRWRRTFAHRWLLDGGNEGDLMARAGWKSRQMLSCDGASAASERARAAHRERPPADSLLGSTKPDDGRRRRSRS